MGTKSVDRKGAPHDEEFKCRCLCISPRVHGPERIVTRAVSWGCTQSQEVGHPAVHRVFPPSGWAFAPKRKFTKASRTDRVLVRDSVDWVRDGPARDRAAIVPSPSTFRDPSGLRHWAGPCTLFATRLRIAAEHAAPRTIYDLRQAWASYFSCRRHPLHPRRGTGVPSVFFV
jgi:hypothetical protein